MVIPTDVNSFSLAAGPVTAGASHSLRPQSHSECLVFLKEWVLPRLVVEIIMVGWDELVAPELFLNN